MYDYIYNTLDKSSDMLYEKSLERQGQLPDVVHLTHLTTPESIYHLRLGISSFASEPYTSKWYFWLMWPVTLWSMIVTWIYGNTFTVERNLFKNLNLQTWAIPKYRVQVSTFILVFIDTFSMLTSVQCFIHLIVDFIPVRHAMAKRDN